MAFLRKAKKENKEKGEREKTKKTSENEEGGPALSCQKLYRKLEGRDSGLRTRAMSYSELLARLALRFDVSVASAHSTSAGSAG